MARLRSTGRRWAWWAVLAGVGLLHGGVVWRGQDTSLGDGAAPKAPAAMDVTFVHELMPAAPPQRVARVAVPVKAKPAALPASAPADAPPDAPASAPRAEPGPDLPPGRLPVVKSSEDAVGEQAASATDAQLKTSALGLAGQVDLPGGAAGDALAASGAAGPPSPLAAASGAASAALDFDWPPSTRLSYLLTGNYRGPLYGKAQVEWLRQGAHYQVRLTVKVYPVFERRMLSDGRLGPDGLSPQRFDQETDIPFQGTRSETVFFDQDQIRLANGQHSVALAGAQDSASQFVQLSWLYLTQARRLAVGESVSFPLALPRRVGQWTYDVTEQVRLDLPMGPVDSFHLVPRKLGRKANELSVQMWLAPSLQYLPVRISIEQDSETHLQLDLEKPPLQAAAP